jgi:hypothetical protein
MESAKTPLREAILVADEFEPRIAKCQMLSCRANTQPQ